MDKDNDYILTGEAFERYFDLNKALSEFYNLFKYDVGDDRAIVIVGASFLDFLLKHILLAFFPEKNDEVATLMQSDQPLGTYGNKVRMTYCLGLIEKVVKDDLKLIGKIRNRFAHDLYASFDDQNIKSWCVGLRWHRISLADDPPVNASIRDFYQVGVNQLITYLNGAVSIARINKRKLQHNF